MIRHVVTVLRRKVKQGEGDRSDRWWRWDRKAANVVNRGISNKVTSGPRPERSKGASLGDIWVG